MRTLLETGLRTLVTVLAESPLSRALLSGLQTPATRTLPFIQAHQELYDGQEPRWEATLLG